MQLLTTLRVKIDIYKLEQRYTRRDKRTTFASGAQYVDGEYIYAQQSGHSNRSNASRPTLSSTKSSTSFGTTGSAASGKVKALGKRASRMFS